MINLTFDTEISVYPEDSDGYFYDYDLFVLAECLAEDSADKYYQHLKNY